MSKHVALVVDDEPDICELAQLTLARMDIESHSAGSLSEARKLLAQNKYDLCLCDLRLPDGNGIELVKFVHEDYPSLPVAMITAHGNMESAIQALKAGAFDFVSKPVDLHMLRNLVGQALRLSDKAEASLPSHALTLLGNSAAICSIREKVTKLARSQAPIYISGESGTGKELVARMLHDQGARTDKPFVPVNCGAIPENLVESEFFGHKKGSFTGAATDKEGLFQAADGGTLFLDEVADLPLSMQVKLLRAIQEKSVRPIGAARETAVDVRILSATHKDLAQLVKDGAFRQDLFYRINVIELHLPSLREREEDIPLLAKHILGRLTGGSGNPLTLTAKTLEALRRYSFPGNVRELENILERAVTLCDGVVISEDDLDLSITATENDTQSDLLAPYTEDVPLEDYLGLLEKTRIIKALEETKYNKTKAAKLLGITFRALRYRLKKLGME